MGSWCVTGTEFQFWKATTAPQVDGSGGRTAASGFPAAELRI